MLLKIKKELWYLHLQHQFYCEYGYILRDVNLDLASSEIENIPTEYEIKFMKLGVKINYLVAEKN